MMSIMWMLSFPANAADFSSSPSMHHMASANPHGVLDYLIVFASLALVLFVTIYTIKLFIRPKEQNKDHIKRRILEF